MGFGDQLGYISLVRKERMYHKVTNIIDHSGHFTKGKHVGKERNQERRQLHKGNLEIYGFVSGGVGWEWVGYTKAEHRETRKN